MERSATVLLACLCALLYLPPVARLPPVDRDEPRFAQATRQMIDAGNYIEPRFGDEGRYKKPIGIYWLQAAAVLVVGRRDAIWAYRLPSVVGAIAAVLATHALGRGLFGPRAGFLAALLLATSPLVAIEATLATTDAALLAAIVAGQGCLAAIFAARDRGERASRAHTTGFWCAEAVALLLKGPVGPGVAAMTIAALAWAERSAARSPSRSWVIELRDPAGLAAFALLVAPWSIAVAVATRGRFWVEAVGGDILPKIAGAQESHGAPPGYYLALAPATFWPVSVAAFAAARRAWSERGEVAVTFCLAWIVPTWILLETLPTKLPHYVLPTYPAIALLAAHAIVARPDARAGRVGLAVWAAIGTALSMAAFVAPLLLTGHVTPLASYVAALVLLAVMTCLFVLRRLGIERGTIVTATIGALSFAACASVLLPALAPLWPSALMAEATRTLRADDPLRRVAVVGYREPSLVFLLAGDVSMIDERDVPRFLADSRDGLVWVPDDRRRAVESTAARPLEVLAVVDGWNFSKGRRIRMLLFAPRTPEQDDRRAALGVSDEFGASSGCHDGGACRVADGNGGSDVAPAGMGEHEMAAADGRAPAGDVPQVRRVRGSGLRRPYASGEDEGVDRRRGDARHPV